MYEFTFSSTAQVVTALALVTAIATTFIGLVA
jgi:hypothetical protein